MLRVRLQRRGKRGYASFAVIVTEHTRGPAAPALERLGWWNPHQNRFVVDEKRLRHWLGRGAQLSPTVHNLLVEQKLIEAEKVRAWRPKKKGKDKGEEGGGEKARAPEKAEEKTREASGEEREAGQ